MGTWAVSQTCIMIERYSPSSERSKRLALETSASQSPWGGQWALCRTWSRARIPLINRSLDGKSSKCSSFSAIVRSIPRLIILLKIKRNDWAIKLKRRLFNLRRRHSIALKAFCSLNERLDCLPSSMPLLNGIKACDQVLQWANLPFTPPPIHTTPQFHSLSCSSVSQTRKAPVKKNYF